MNLTPYFKSIIDQDTASVVICNLDHEIIYMNPSGHRQLSQMGRRSADQEMPYELPQSQV